MGTIYTITCTITNTTYVGGTVNIHARWNAHRSRLQRGKHENEHLQRAWDKYGKDAFEWGIIEQVPDGADLIEHEQHWLDRYLENPNKCYNVAGCAEASSRGIHFTKDHRQKISRALMGNQNGLGVRLSEEHKHKLKQASSKPYPALIHQDTGEVIPPGMNLSKLCRERGLIQAPMWNVIHGNRNHHKGWTLLVPLLPGADCVSCVLPDASY